MTALGEYLERTGQSQSAFAEKAGVDRAMVTHYANGDRRPGLRYALAIEEATKDPETGIPAVPASYWSEFKTKKRKQ